MMNAADMEGRRYVACRLLIRDVRVDDLLAHYDDFADSLFQVVKELRPQSDGDYVDVGTYNDATREWEMFSADAEVWVLRPEADAQP
jgi:hypothetical protein